MYYRNNIPTNFKYIVEVNDNYIIWSDREKLYNDNYYEVYIQYFKPCYYIIHIDNYTIKNGSNFTITPNYNEINNTIENYNISYELETSEQVSGEDYTNNIEYIADYNEVHTSLFLLLVVILWVFNMISKLWYKGGCFK